MYLQNQIGLFQTESWQTMFDWLNIDSVCSDVCDGLKFFFQIFGFTKQHKIKLSYQLNNLWYVQGIK